MKPTEINILPAYHGDCFLIKTYDKYDNPFNILIDGGPAKAFKYTLRKELEEINTIHLLVLTHIDGDHIGGLLRFFKHSLFHKINIERYWINTPKLISLSTGTDISFNQQVKLEQFLLTSGEAKEKFEGPIFHRESPIELKGISFEILSPFQQVLDELIIKGQNYVSSQVGSLKKESISSQSQNNLVPEKLESLAEQAFNPDKSLKSDLINNSSIAFIMTLFDCKILFLADSRPETIVESLRNSGYSEDNPLEVDFVKVSHHGSKNNTSCELLDLIECNSFIISTNGGSGKSRHPHRETIARIIHHPGRNYQNRRFIYLNYSLKEIAKKTGEIIIDEDFLTGNWELKEPTRKITV